ncbi:MAG: hypothetical protein ACSLFF_07400 [Solirubrobacterales bacterium]
MPPRPKTQDGSAWQPVATAGLIALIVFSLLLMRWMATDSDGYLRIIDDINLVIHEAGHPIFALFGEWPQWWGGTLMELLVPGVAAGAFIYQRSALSAAFAGVWLFENLHYIAWYMADASTEALPLIGGGEHDWNTIFTHHGWIEHDTEIAHAVNTIGYVGIVACLLFAGGVWLTQRRQREPLARSPYPTP